MVYSFQSYEYLLILKKLPDSPYEPICLKTGDITRWIALLFVLPFG